MKIEIKVIKREALEGFQNDVQEAINEGFEVKFTNAYGIENSTGYYAYLEKDMQKQISMYEDR